MMLNYLKIAWRNLYKNKAFSAINILGLGLGMASSLLISLWVSDEQGVDAFYSGSDQLFSIYESQHHDGVIDGGHYTPGMLYDELKTLYPEVQYATPMAWEHVATFEAKPRSSRFQVIGPVPTSSRHSVFR